MSKVTSIIARMYRHGFGDCFLLRFLSDDKVVFNMLIDCGLKMNQRLEEVPIEAVIQDLKDTLTPSGGKRPELDVLVATHEHWDHISAFHPDKGFFDDFDIDKIWLAWTENPKDGEAKVINSRLRKGVTALALAAERLNTSKQATIAQQSKRLHSFSIKKSREDFNDQLKDVMGFYGGTALTSKGGIKYKNKAKISSDTQEAMEHLISLAKGKTGVEFFEPGKMVDKKLLPDGVNVYVLGPPKNKWINTSNPKKGPDKEVYFGLDGDSGMGFVNGLLAMNGPGGSITDDGRPFSKVKGATSNGTQIPYYRQSYLQRGQEWRKIENDWLDVTGQFALQLDGAINNTSLVLAIEIEGSEKVLLFPGDAQVGSWMSWHDYEWEIKRDGKKVKLKAEDILKNTVLYKVSHHGSHNATVKDKGLEMMVHDNLVAFIPEKEGSYNGILYPPLLKRLKEMCKGRVVVSADKKESADKIKLKKPDALSAKQWTDFKKNLHVTPLYIEYTIHG